MKSVNWQKSVTYGFNIRRSRIFCMIGDEGGGLSEIEENEDSSVDIDEIMDPGERQHAEYFA